MDTRWLMSRRALLGGLSAAGISALLPRGLARAQTAPSTRLIIVHVPEGMWNGAPRPKNGGTDLGPILEALQPYQSRINVLQNLTIASRDHGPGGDGHHRAIPHMFTGTEMLDENNAGGASIDQKIAQAIGGSSQFASLQFAIRIVYADTNSTSIWSAPGRVVLPEQDPWRAYDRIMSGVVPSGAPAPSVNLKQSALDYALADLNGLRGKLPASDRERLDSYQDSLRDIERRLALKAQPAVAGCAPPTLGNKVDVKAEANYEHVADLQMDIMVAAMQCGLTRVSTLQWGNSNDQCTYSFLGVNTLGHDMAHNNNSCDNDGSKKLTTYKWYSTKAKQLLDRLDAVPEGSGTMLDNTVVLWASEFGDSNGHSSSNLMWLMMGSAGGYFRTGRVIDCGGRSVNDVHTSLGNAMGLPDQSFGNPAYCSGPITELNA